MKRAILHGGVVGTGAQSKVVSPIDMAEARPLTDDRDRKKNKLHWLEKWARTAGERVVYKEFRLLVGPQLNTWIQRQAEKAGGRFTAPATPRSTSTSTSSTR
mgnify:CR=1 FL=1